MAQAPLQRKLRWQLEALGVRLLLLALRGRSHRSMGRGIAQAHRLARPWLRRRHTTAITNLTRVYGEQLSQGEREAIAEQSINSFFLSCLESIIQPVDTSLISAEGEELDELLRLHRQGQGVIVGSGAALAERTAGHPVCRVPPRPQPLQRRAAQPGPPGQQLLQLDTPG